MIKKLELSYIKDEPILASSSHYFDFYHKSFVPALIDVLDQGSNVKTIGLFGGWGTGKSTVIEQLRENDQFLVPIFDVWKYQDDSLRRAFLLYIHTYFKGKGISFDKNVEKELKGLYLSTEDALATKSPNPSINSPWWTHLWLAIKKNWQLSGLLPLAVIWILARTYLTGSSQLIAFLRELPGYIMFSAPIWWIFKTMAEKMLTEFTSNALSTFKPLLRTQTITERKEALNSPEQFELLFEKIISTLPNDKKIAIVFDNLDRVQGDIAVQVLTTIKTFLEPKLPREVAFIIPCDHDAVRQQVLDRYPGIDADEFLRKLFGVTMWTPEFIPSDLEEYTRKLLSETGRDSGLINKEEVIYVITQAFSRNPRQIKQFINNLISLLFVAHKTAVWSTVEAHTEYLTKVLVIRQLYPDGYKKLKDHWFEPENILSGAIQPSKEEAALRDFILNTQKITVHNAKPFLYFKKAYQASNIESSDELQQALVQGRIDGVKKIIESNKDINKVANFITGLYPEYILQDVELRNIVVSHLEALAQITQKITRASYYVKTMDLIDRQLWKDYLLLPTDIVFNYLVGTQESSTLRYRRNLVDRYASSLSNDELAKEDLLSKAVNIVKCLLATPPKLLTDVHKQKIRDGVEKNFKGKVPVLELFQNQNDITTYISDQTVKSSIAAIGVETASDLLPIVSRYKSRLLTTEFANFFTETATSLITQFAATPDYTSNKALSMAELSNCIFAFTDVFKVVDQEPMNRLGSELYKFSTHIAAADNRKDALLALSILLPFIEPPHHEQAKSELNKFLRDATPGCIDSFLSISQQKANVETLVEQIFPEYMRVFRERKDCRDLLYKHSTQNQKKILLDDIVQHTPEKGLDFLSTLKSLPARKQSVSLLMHELDSLQAHEAREGYRWAVAHTSINDDETIKEVFESHILKRLKIDDNNSGEVGSEVFKSASFLGSRRLEKIVQELLVWLGEPGRVINSNHKFALQTVVFSIDDFKLEGQFKNDFVKLLLKHLRSETDRPTLEIILDSLTSLAPRYRDTTPEFDDVLNSLRSWPIEETRNLVVNMLLVFKPTKVISKEKPFWNELAAMSAG